MPELSDEQLEIFNTIMKQRAEEETNARKEDDPVQLVIDQIRQSNETLTNAIQDLAKSLGVTNDTEPDRTKRGNAFFKRKIEK